MSKQLRADVVAFISHEDNKESFKASLQGRVYDKFGNEPIANMKVECDEILSSLSKYTTHGGSETLRAVVLMFQVNIMVINEEGDYYFANKFDTSYRKTIILAYKLKKVITKQDFNEPRNHYDSVVHIDANDLYTMTQVIANKMRK